MQYRTLGRTGIDVSLLSYGSGGARNLGQNQDLPDADQNALIRRCLDLGINLFDTSENYGRSEEILGRALAGVSRDSYYLCTKFWYEGRDPAKDLAEALDRSLARLRTEYVDIFMLHGLLPSQYDEAVDRFYTEMQRAKEAGKIRFVGFSERFHEDPAHEAAERAVRDDAEPWDVIMLKYGILNQAAANAALPLAQERGVGIMNMAAVRVKLPDPELLVQTIAEWKERDHIAGDSIPERDPLGWLVHDDVDSVVSAGYKFAADHPAVSTVLTGTASIDHLNANAAALDHPALNSADTKRLKSLFGEIVEYA